MTEAMREGEEGKDRQGKKRTVMLAAVAEYG